MTGPADLTQTLSAHLPTRRELAHRPGEWLDAYRQLGTQPEPAEEILPAAVYAIGPRPLQVHLALARIMSTVQLWEAAGQGATLDTYIHGFHPGPGGTLDTWAALWGGYEGTYEPGRNPLDNLRPFRDHHGAKLDAAATLRYPHGGAS